MIQSIARAFDILKTVSAFPKGLSSGALAEITGLHPSTASRIVSTLEELGALKRLDGSLVVIGQGIVDMVDTTPWTQRLIHIAQPVLQDLASETGEAIGLTSMSDGLCEIFYQSTSDYHVQIRDWTNLSFPAHVTSTGKLYFALSPASVLESYLQSPLAKAKMASASISQANVLRADVQNCHLRGFAWTVDELEDGLSSIAAPITDPTGAFKAGLYLSAPSYRISSKDLQQRLEYLIPTAAKEISERLTKIPAHTTSPITNVTKELNHVSSPISKP